MKNIILLIIIFLIIILLKKLFTKPKNTPYTTELVECAHCGLYLPKNKAIKSKNKYFCSKQHQKNAL